eukprot:gb/GECG01005318.1/.p1 GENE.gb/GECG01005318.1/~~gb/GECG01005318.1/.p1  ORF type:complete len:1128 (+),score=99.32 gb/GECG01005318.1/:1-3384(+)
MKLKECGGKYESNIFRDDVSQSRYQGNMADVTWEAFGALEVSPALTEMLESTSPSPFVWTPQQCQLLAQINDAVYAGLCSLISRWPREPTLQKKLPLPEKIKEVFTEVWGDGGGTITSLGTLRPDFLFTEDGDIKVCEINCRFPLNGFLIGAVVNSALHEAAASGSSCLSDYSISADSASMSLIKDLRSRFERDTTVWIVRGRETVHDTGLFGQLTYLGVCVCNPSEIFCTPHGALAIVSQDGASKEVHQCILELHQDEILSLSVDVLKGFARLSQRGRCLNDLRTIFLAHDKLMLQLLRSEVGNLSEEYRKTLKRHVIPTISLERLDDGAMELMQDGMVIKPRLAGKGEGVVVQSQFTTSEFHEKLQELRQHGQHVAQPYVRQHKFQVTSSAFQITRYRVVGTFLSLDGIHYGPGLCRSSASHVISLSSGGIPIFPAILISDIPRSDRFFYGGLETVDGYGIREALAKDGMALVATKSELGNKDQLQRFIENILGGNLRRHSDKEGYVWDVKPQPASGGHVARSHTKKQFDVHTDATFEEPPPRFVALAIVRADKTYHGLFGLTSVGDAVADLSAQDEVILQETQVNWKVPPEFQKGKIDRIRGPVLLSDTRARLRRDSIDTSDLTQEQEAKFWKAFDRLEEILQQRCDASAMVVPERTILITDNHRFAHSRGIIKESRRYLQRIRFDFDNAPEVDSVLLSAKRHRMYHDRNDLSLTYLGRSLSGFNLRAWPILSKQQLVGRLQDHFGTCFYGKGGLYWSPAGGTTPAHSASSSSKVAVPRTNSENVTMRTRLRKQMQISGLLDTEVVAVNLFASGNLIRSMEVFQDVLLQVNATHLPVGANASDDEVLEAIYHFGVNFLAGWGTRILQLALTCKNLGRKLPTVRRVVHGGEPLDINQRSFIRDMCHSECQLFGVYGSAEAGVFAIGQEAGDTEHYTIASDTVYPEILAQDADTPVEPGNPGRLVLTNLVRKEHPLVRFDTGDLVKQVGHSCSKIEVLGRTPGSRSMPFGSKFISWEEVATVVRNGLKQCRFEEDIPSMFQLWIDRSEEGIKSTVTLAIVEPSSDKLLDISKALHSVCLDLQNNVFNTGTNVDSVKFEIVDSLYRSKRSAKLQYFVDRRQSHPENH